MPDCSNPRDSRVLLLAPTPKDAAFCVEFLAAEGVACQICKDIAEVSISAREGAGAVVVPEEAVLGGRGKELGETLRNQASWSGLPIIVLTCGPAPAGKVRALLKLGEVTLLQRPLEGAVFVSSVLAALRDRQRQYQVRDHLRERERMEEELRAADRKKDDFIALLAHELRNPLAPLRNGLQVLRLAAGNVDAVAQARAMMDRQLSHMVRLIDDLLDVSRISRKKMVLRRERILLGDVVSSAVETVRPLIEAAGHELTLSLPPAPVFLDADLTRLSQVFSNLLTNSAKYTPHGGKISLAAARRVGEVVVTVRDNGIGIPAEALPSIFEMFSQVDRSIERAAGGLGIGLALVKCLVEMHGGTVVAHSQEGQGSTFTVRLPEGRPGAPKPGVAENSFHAARRVLVVDDNRDGATSMANLLRLMGDEVRTAHDGLEAIEVARTFLPQVILMDIGMPRLNGLAATRRIREQPWGQGITILALTGWGQDVDKERSRAAGCDGHVVKPVNLADLEKLLADPRI